MDVIVYSTGEAMTEQNVDRLHVPQTQSVHIQDTEEDGDDDTVRIRVPLASTDVNRDGHKLTMDGLRDIAEQLQSGEVPLYMDHGLSKETGFREYTVEDMIGKWVDSETNEEAGVVDGIAELEDSEKAETLVSKLEQELPVGFSIGFIPDRESAVEMDGGGMKWNDVDLLETSAVGIPSDPNAVAAGAMIAQAFDGDVDEAMSNLVQNQEGEEELMEMLREVVSGELDTHREMLVSDVEALFEEYTQEEEQNMTDKETQAEGDTALADHAEAFASHVEGMDSGDVMDAVPEDGEYVGSAQVPEYAAILADRYDVDQSEMMDRIEGDSDSEEESIDVESLKEDLREEVTEDLREDVREEILSEELDVQDPEGTIQTPEGEEQSTDGDTASRWVEPKR